MKSNEFKELPVADLIERIETEQVNLNKLKINHQTSPVENPTQIRRLRRNIARMQTVLRQKQTVNR